MGRMQRFIQQNGERVFRDRFFVIGNGQSSFGYMKNPFGGPPVIFRIVKNALLDPVTVDDARNKNVLVGWQGERPCNPVTVGDECVGWQPGMDFVAKLRQMAVQEILNPLVSRTKVGGKQPVFFAVILD